MRRWLGLQLVVICGAAVGAAQAAEPLPRLFIPVGASASDDAIGALLAKSNPAVDALAVDWRSTQVRLTPKAALRIRVADPFTGPGARGAPLTHRPGEGESYEVTLVRDWPRAVSVKTRSLGVDLSPHAAVGVTPYGGLAEAGARLEVSKRKDEAVVEGLNAIGVRDGAKFGDKGRWYLFAAASGRAVGLNMLRNEGGWDRAGWTTDQSSTLVGDAQVGVGWRKGPMQTSFGVLHREVKAEHTYYGYRSQPDSVVAFSFAVRPGQ